jgi:hypothetical protein
MASEVEPIAIGKGAGDDFEWRYKMKKGSTDTHLEFSSSIPPVHRVSYRVLTDTPSPDDMRVVVKAVFRQRGKILRSKSHLSLPPSLRLFGDRRFRHLVMELETRIGKDGEDNFQFPGPNKSGCRLLMGLNIGKGKIWQGNSDGKDIGVVKSKFESPTLKVANESGNAGDQQ